MKELRCTWCMKDVPSSPCPHCGNDYTVVDKNAPHHHEWSRRTINTMECKQCEKVISNNDYFSNGDGEDIRPKKV